MLLLKGRWTGKIIFGKRYGEYKGKELLFAMDLMQENNKITGTSIDIGGVGMSPDPAIINGTIENKKISFVKQYLSAHSYNSDGEVVINREQLGPEIYYTGLYNDIENNFSGVWRMKLIIKLFRIIPIKYFASGTWSMKRQ